MQTCWINPRQPEQAVLERSVSSLAWVLLVPILLLLLAGFGANLGGRKSIKKDKSKRKAKAPVQD